MLQLKPVGGAQVFDDPSRKKDSPAVETCVANLWREVEVAELTELMRSKDDPAWGEFLMRVREALGPDDLLAEDWNLLESRKLSSLGLKPEDVREIVHLFPTNKQVNGFNDARLAELEAELREKCEREKAPLADYVLDIKALDTMAEAEDRKFFKGKDITALAPKSSDETGGLVQSLKLVRGMKIMLRQNVAVKDRLANGSTGWETESAFRLFCRKRMRKV